MLPAFGWLVAEALWVASIAFVTVEVGEAVLEGIDAGSEYNRAVRDTDTISDRSGDAAYRRIQEAHRNGHQRQAVAIYGATRAAVKEVLLTRIDEQYKPSIKRLLPEGTELVIGFGEVDLAADVWGATHPDEPVTGGGPTGPAGSGSGSASTQPGAVAQPGVIVFRGQVDDTTLTAQFGGLIMNENLLELRAPKDGGRIEGTLVLEWKDFALGQFLVGFASGIADGLYPGLPQSKSDRDKLLATCKSDIRVDGTLEGEFEAGISKLLGTVTYRLNALNNVSCAGPLPKDFTDAVGAGAIITTSTWTAVYDGVKTASGAIAETSPNAKDSMSFRLTVVP